MRTLIVLVALIFAPAAHAQTLADLAWLKGCWRTTGDGPVITEVWLAPPMPAMIGYSYTVGEGETQGWEAMRIEMINGRPHFVAMPNGGPAVRSWMADNLRILGVDHSAMFHNREHDYPQMISYTRKGNRLSAVISGANGSDPITFEYRRINCGANLRP